MVSKDYLTLVATTIGLVCVKRTGMHTHTHIHTHAPLSDYLISNLFASTLIYSSNRKINLLQFSFLIKDILLRKVAVDYNVVVVVLK